MKRLFAFLALSFACAWAFARFPTDLPIRPPGGFPAGRSGVSSGRAAEWVLRCERVLS
jgi:hypothetical protein